MINEIEKIMDNEIRPALSSHGGGVEVIDVDNGVVFLKLIGGCQGCVMSRMTLKSGIEKAIQAHYPDLKVMDMTDHESGKDAYFKSESGLTPFDK